MDKKNITLIVVGAGILLGWFFRLDVTPINSGDGIGAAFVLNRWTGESYYTRGYSKGEVRANKPSE